MEEATKFLSRIQKKPNFEEKSIFINEYFNKSHLFKINQDLRKNHLKLGHVLFIKSNKLNEIVICTSKSMVIHYDNQENLKSIFACDLNEKEIELEDISCLEFQNNLIFVGFDSGYLLMFDTLLEKEILQLKASENSLKSIHYFKKQESILVSDHKGNLTIFKIQKQALFKDLFVSKITKSEIKTKNMSVCADESISEYILVAIGNDKELEISKLHPTLEIVQQFKSDELDIFSWSNYSKLISKSSFRSLSK
jgi:hypothetical protein